VVVSCSSLHMWRGSCSPKNCAECIFYFLFNSVHVCFINMSQRGVSGEEATSEVPCTFGGICSAEPYPILLVLTHGKRC